MSSRGRERQSPWPMVSVDDALVQILTTAKPLTPTKVPIARALGCVLAEDVGNPEPQPPFAASIMDGYAVVASDGPGTYPVVGRITAGVDPDEKGIVVKSGVVAYITTGAKMPKGADAVVKVEDTDAGEVDAAGKEVSVKITASGTEPGKWIRAIGSDMAAGEVVLQQGTEIHASELGVLASVGASEVLAFPKPVVGVLSTGDELVEHTDASPGKIRDSNRPSLLALYGGDGFRTLDLGIAKDADGEAALRAKVQAALQKVDVLITSGGVSMGEADLLKPALASLGKVHFGRLNMKPGKPTTFATVELSPGAPPKLIFALPGNPVSCMVTSYLLVQPALRLLQGLPPARCMSPQVQVRLGSKVVLDPERPEYQRVVIRWDGIQHSLVAESTGRQISSRLLSMRSANGLLCLPAGMGSLSPGQEATALLFGPLPPPAPHTAFHQKAALAGSQEQAALAQGGGAGGEYVSFDKQLKSLPQHRMRPHDPTLPPQPGAPFSANLKSLPQHRLQHHNPTLPAPEPEYEGCPCCQPASSSSTATPAPPPAPNAPIRVALLTVSDRASSGGYEDKSGPAMEALLTGPAFVAGGVTAAVVARVVVPDEVPAIQEQVSRWADSNKVDAIFTSGGTGFAPRDMTPEAIRPLLTKEAPGLVFRIMQVGTQHTPLAVLSRPVAGVRGSTLIVTLPGSPKAVKENLEALLPLLPKIFSLIRTSTCDHKDEATALLGAAKA